MGSLADLPAGRYAYCYLAIDEGAGAGGGGLTDAADDDPWPIHLLGFVSTLDLADYLDAELRSPVIGPAAGATAAGNLN